VTDRFTIAIVGRPNVGKSTLFNKMIGRRKSLAFSRPGITRDSVVEGVSFQGKEFNLVDTGGYPGDESCDMETLVKGQVLQAISGSDLVLVVLDGKEGVTSVDMEVIRLLREGGKDFLVALNKIDWKGYTDTISSVYELGVERFFEVSAEHGTGVMELLEEIGKHASGKPIEKETEPLHCLVQIAGRPNVGKSTLANSLIGDERMIASPQPGTTRDSVDVEITCLGKKIILVDTPGIRPRRKTIDPVDKIMSIRSLKSLKRCDVAILIIDITEGFTRNDLLVLRNILDGGRGVVIGANKIDLLTPGSLAAKLDDLSQSIPFGTFIPLVPLSAEKGMGTLDLMEKVFKVFDEHRRRIQTSLLNRATEELISRTKIPGTRKMNKVFYVTQTGTSPPAFTLFVSEPQGIPLSYTRFVTNRLRQRFGFEGTPLIIRYRKK